MISETVPGELEKQIEKSLEYTIEWSMTANNGNKSTIIHVCHEDKKYPVEFKWM